MKLDIITERQQTVEVSWTEKSKHGCKGTTVLGGVRYKINLIKTRFDGQISVYPEVVTLDKFNAGKSLSAPVKLPKDLVPFIGSIVTVEGVDGDILRKMTQAIELLDELPPGAEGTSFREALYADLDMDRTIAIFGALGFELTPDQFEDYDDAVAAKQMERETG